MTVRREHPEARKRRWRRCIAGRKPAAGEICRLKLHFDRLGMDKFEHRLDELGVKAHFPGARQVVFQKVFPPVELQYRNVMLALDPANILNQTQALR